MEERSFVKVGDVFVRRESVYVILKVEKNDCVLCAMNAPTPRIISTGKLWMPADVWFRAGFRLM